MTPRDRWIFREKVFAPLHFWVVIDFHNDLLCGHQLWRR
jgi:hypothetical protein